VTCPDCDRSAAYHRDGERHVVSALGLLHFRRAYYYCRCCGRGVAPFDRQAGFTARQLTPAAERLATLAGGVCESFERGADTLHEMAGIRLSESTVGRTTEDVGARLAEMFQQEQTVGPAVRWEWHLDAMGQKVAYITIDATGTRQQGPGGKKAEGRMAYVAGVYNPAPADWLLPPGKMAPQMQARYISGLYSLDQMGPLLRRQAARVGMEDAEVWVALTDGGNGLEDFCQKNFNRADLVLILDFYHAATYLEDLAKALFPQAEEEAKAQAEQWCRILKAEGGTTTLAVLENAEWPARKSAALKEQLETTRGYFANNLHRMDYPEYQARGWQIGSGVVESACKTVVGQRMKGAGMRWSEEGAHALCHVRALYRSEKGQWDAFWERQFTKRASVQQPK
jgi:hypothetical protein